MSDLERRLLQASCGRANRRFGCEAGKKIVNKIITKRAPGLSVANANALGGTAANAFAPVSYASVNADGTVNAAGSKGFATANVTKPASTTGVYCFHGLAAVPKNVEATANNQNYGALNVETDSSAFNNPAIAGRRQARSSRSSRSLAAAASPTCRSSS